MPLQIIIVGGGIAGLGAAIALSRQGHEIHLYEKSSFSRETGAAIALSPPTVKILKAWNVNIADMQPSECLAFPVFNAADLSQPPVLRWDYKEKAKELSISEPDLLVHRTDVHSTLRDEALSKTNVKLHLSSAVAKVDATNGKVHLASGAVHSADLVIGADGIHSTTIQALGVELPLIRLPINMYRFMVPVESALKDPLAHSILSLFDWENCRAWFEMAGNLRMLFMMPCRSGKLFNFITACLAKDDPRSTEEEWNSPAAPEDVANMLVGFPEALRRFARLSNEVTHWAAWVRDSPPDRYYKDHLVVIGDAAHPMVNTLAAGAATGLADAATLGVLLPRDVRVDQIEERLGMFNKLRYARNVTTQIASSANIATPEQKEALRLKLRTMVPGAELPEDNIKFLWDIDVIKLAEDALEESSSSVGRPAA